MDLAVAVLIVVALAAATVAMACRRNRQVSRMPDEQLSADMWPLAPSDGESAVPYLRGASGAAQLAGRR